MITSLQPNEIFIFGSNLAGNHVGGSAKQAVESFGAIMGQGEGLQGRCYAFPTLNENIKQRWTSHLENSVKKLYDCCLSNPDKKFLLTKVGCGIAGYDEDFIKSLFTNPPSNLVLPNDWK